MNDKYVAMDVHKASVAIGVRDAEGKYLMESIVETKAITLLEFVKGLSGTIHLTLEEGNKGDRIDVQKLSQLLQAGMLQPVYHGDHGTRALKELVHGYESLVRDRTRVKNRLKAIYRGRGISCDGEEVYHPEKREQWVAQLGEPGVRQRAVSLYQQLESLNAMVAEMQRRMLAESRRHKAAAILRSLSTLGPISVAMIIATCDTPHRFRTKRQFWTYCGFAVVTRTSSDHYFENGELHKRRKPALTRGLNRNYNRRLKRVFKSAATSGSRRGPFKPLYEQLLTKGLKPDLAKLTLARRISAIALALWKKGERFDPQKLK